MEELMNKLEELSSLRKQFNEKKNQFDEQTYDLQARIKLLEEEIKTAVLELKQSLKGKGIDVIYNKGRETWDGKILTGFAVAHPEILIAKKIGQPTVSFKPHKEE